MDVERALNGRQITTRFLRQHKYGELSLSTVCAVVQPAILGEPKKMISHLFPAGYGVRMFPILCTYYSILRTSTEYSIHKGLLPFGLISEESMLLTRSATENLLGLVIGWMPASFNYFEFSFFLLFDFGPARESENWPISDGLHSALVKNKVSIRATWIVPKPPNNWLLFLLLSLPFFPFDPHIRGRIIFSFLWPPLTSIGQLSVVW